VAYGVTGSSLMLCYGLENLVDFLSSIVVCWRFFSPSGTTSAHDADLRKREKRASIAISFILALLGIGVIVASIEDFTHGSETLDNLKKIIITAIFSVFVFGTMSMVKFHYAKMLQSASLQKDAVCSLIGTVLSGSLFVNSLIIMKESDAWWLDPLIALGCGTAALIIGMQAIYYAYVVQGIPVLNIKWWMTSQGDGTDEFTGRELTPEERGEVPADKESEMVGASGNDEDRSRNEEGSGDGEKPESEIV